MKSKLKLVLIVFLLFPNIGWTIGESCNALLNLGLYNVTQSSKATDAQTLLKSTFCSYDYSRTDLSTGQSAAIEGSYGLFSANVSGSVNKSEIIQTQKSICKSGFNSTAYRNLASEFSRTVYQGSLDAWNKCQFLASKGLIFEVQPSSTLQGVSVIFTVSTGLSAKFLGVAQFGVGRSDCTTILNGRLVNVGPSAPIDINSASKLTVNCSRQMTASGADLSADAQDLVFVTSADSFKVPLAAIGNLSRATTAQLKTELINNTQALITTNNRATQNLINNVDKKFNKLDSYVSDMLPSTVQWSAGDGSCFNSCPAGYVLATTSYENPSKALDCNVQTCVKLGVKLKSP